ncbi:DUF2946 family protein [Burkholderia sp. 22PA0099]|uniref:DUF2946 family protein n=1 Tax=Burkholderia sp. 22PA0099 TaxID=3237372 RepID=UPI0039C04140
MNRLRHLLAQRANHPLLSALILCVLAFRLILPAGLMLDTSADSGAAGLAICSGHGPLDLTSAATQAADDLSRALTQSPDSHHARGSAHGELCPFSASLASAITLAVLVAVLWNGLGVVARRAAPRIVRFRPPPAHARPGARAPPRFVPA